MARDARVSVVVPVRDGERYLEEALESIASQTLAAGEVVVVDDGSEDGSAELARRLGARVERQPPAGAAAARNRGVGLARGELVAFLDADDVWAPDKLERQVEALDSDPAVDILFGHVRQFVAPDLDPAAAARMHCPDEAQPGYLFGCLLVRRRALEQVGPFSTEWHVGELMEWLLRARDAGVGEAVLPRVVLRRRLHERNTSLTEWDNRADNARILKRALDRRRARAGG